jgi:hypothetical protein
MSVSPSKQAAIAAYRNLLKTQREVFTGMSCREAEIFISHFK